MPAAYCLVLVSILDAFIQPVFIVADQNHLYIDVSPR